MRSQRGAEKEWVDNQRERIGPEREVEVDGGWIKGVWGVLKDHDPPALCTPTSLFSLRLSLQPQNTDSHTDAPIAKTYATAEGTSAKQKKKAKGNSFACVFGRPVCGCSSPVEHFTLLLLLKRQIIVTYFSYYYGCGLLLCSFDCTVYFLVISNLFLLLFLLTSMTPTRVSYYQWLFFLHD